MQCPECGSEITESMTMCPACGGQLTATNAARSATGGRSLLSHNFERVLLGGGILTIALGGFLIYYNHWDPPVRYAGKPIDHANAFITILLLTIVAALVATIMSAQRGRLPFIRRIPGLNAIDEAVGRATEMGRPILFSPGLHGLDVPTLQALAVASHVGRTAARYGTRMIIPICDSQIMPVTEQMMREVYTSEGRPEAYRAEDIRFLSDRQFAYAAGVTGILHREKVAASFLFGAFFAESLILAENGQAVGAIQVAGTPDLLQIPFFVVTCDYTIIGDEYYAASAYLTREPTLLGSLVGQDLGKAMIFALIVIGMAVSIFSPENPILQWLGGGVPH